MKLWMLTLSVVLLGSTVSLLAQKAPSSKTVQKQIPTKDSLKPDPKPEAKPLAKPSVGFTNAYPRYIVLSEMITEKQKEPAVAAYLEFVKEHDELENGMVREMDAACKEATGQTGCKYDAKSGAFTSPPPAPTEAK